MYDQSTYDTLARTIYGEARGEYCRPNGGIAAFIAVANVIHNRLKLPNLFGSTVEDICRKPFQFSCWNTRDPNYHLVRAVTPEKDSLFACALRVAEEVLEGRWPDLTHGADHYHATWMKTYPVWADAEKSTQRIGQHIFYRLRV